MAFSMSAFTMPAALLLFIHCKHTRVVRTARRARRSTPPLAARMAIVVSSIPDHR